MSDISFNEESSLTRTAPSVRQPLLVRWILASGVVTSQKQAEYVLIVVGLLALLLAVLVWPHGRAAPENLVEVAAPPGAVPGERVR